MTLADIVLEQAIEHGGAFLKVIQPNDLGLTGGHQKGFHLSKRCWQYFTPQPPAKGVNHDHPVEVTWSDATVTASTVKWYGTGTRAEYRLTGFNRITNFYPLRGERLGGVLVLIYRGDNRWFGHVLDSESDIEAVKAGLGVDLDSSSWALFQVDADGPRSNESTTDCEATRIREFARALDAFPSTKEMARAAREIVTACERASVEPDAQLMKYVNTEYDLFRAIERNLHEEQVGNGFETLEDFLSLAQTITQRRKARAGKSLESHFESMLATLSIPYESQPTLDGTQPDVVIPNKDAYYKPDADLDSLFVVGVKTTCRDRWRQVLEEAPRVSKRYIFTLQKGISSAQLAAMTAAGVQVVVPQGLHESYAKADRSLLVNLADFAMQVRAVLAASTAP